MTCEVLARALSSHKFAFNNEKELQGGLAQALTSIGAEHTPEFRLTKTERIDFLVADGVGIEVKTNDSRGGVGLAAVTRQLWRYAKCPEIKSLILVTTRSKHRELPREILDKPLFVVYLNSFL